MATKSGNLKYFCSTSFVRTTFSARHSVTIEGEGDRGDRRSRYFICTTKELSAIPKTHLSRAKKNSLHLGKRKKTPASLQTTTAVKCHSKPHKGKTHSRAKQKKPVNFTYMISPSPTNAYHNPSGSGESLEDPTSKVEKGTSGRKEETK